MSFKSINPAVTRYKDGVTNVDAEGKLFSQYFDADPTRLHVFWDDFDTFNTNKWVITKTQVGATQALTDGDGGWILLTNTTAASDTNQLANTNKPITLDSTKKHWFKAKFKANTNNTSVFLGIGDSTTGPVGSIHRLLVYTPNPGVNRLDFYQQNGSGSTTTQIGQTATTDITTFTTVGWYYNGVNTFYVFINDVLVLTQPSVNFPTNDLCVQFAIQAMAGVANNLTVDYIFFAQER